MESSKDFREGDMHGTVRAALCTDVVTIGPDASLSAAESLLIERRTPELYVVSPCGLLLGVLPDYELLKLRLLGERPGTECVADVMAVRLETATLDTPLGDVACRLRINVHSRIPVIDDGRLVGYVSRRDVLAALLENVGGDGSSTTMTGGEESRRRKAVHAPNYLRNARLAAAETGV
jgi:CBS-domain-containing membrane protein